MEEEPEPERHADAILAQFDAQDALVSAFRHSFHDSIQKTHNTGSIDWLLSKGCSVNTTVLCGVDIIERPAIQGAIIAGDDKMLAFLIKNGADAGLENSEGQDAAKVAIRWNRPHQLKFVLDESDTVPPNFSRTQDKDGNDLFDLICLHGRFHCYYTVLKYECDASEMFAFAKDSFEQLLEMWKKKKNALAHAEQGRQEAAHFEAVAIQLREELGEEQRELTLLRREYLEMKEKLKNNNATLLGMLQEEKEKVERGSVEDVEALVRQLAALEEENLLLRLKISDDM